MHQHGHPKKKKQNTTKKNIPIPKGLMYGPVNGIVYCPVHGAQYQPDKVPLLIPSQHEPHRHHSPPPPAVIRQSPGVRSRSPPSPHHFPGSYAFSIEDLTGGYLDDEAPPEPPPFIVDTRPPYNHKLRILRTPSKPRVIRDPITMEGAFEPDADMMRCSTSQCRRSVTPVQDVNRNPVTGTGDLGGEMHPTKPFRCISPQTPFKSKIPRVVRDPILGAGELGTSYDAARQGPERPKTPRSKSVQRNPLMGVGDLGRERDPLRESGRRCRRSFIGEKVTRDPIKGKGHFPAEKRCSKRFCHKEAQRDPVVGKGDFSTENEQKVHKRRPALKNVEDNVPRNPIAGVGTEEFDLLYPHRRDPSKTRLGSRRPSNQENRNPITGRGDLGQEYTRLKRNPVCRDLQRQGGSNPITGGTSSSISENTPPRQSRRRLLGVKRANSNPITGNGCDCWDIHREPSSKARQPTPKANSVCNPLTGHNCQAYTLKPEFKSKSKVAVQQSKVSSSNPITGDNCQSFDISYDNRSRTPRRQKGFSTMPVVPRYR
ncbi:uncharacterized protein LOC141906064 isoform X2 [Tubulanus polymorphus]|uniref:uncharacterized protein LOC141906064 isoform X2 n=1 Tax=Tubulanus polymorphus TaxID=672921 RepID=UPI003DA4851C